MANTTDYTRLLNGYALLAIKAYIANNYATKSHTHTKSQITDFPSSMPASDVYAWAKAATKPSYSFSEISNRYDTLIGFSGSAPNIVGNVSAIGMAISPEHGANRLAFVNADALYFEYSTDGTNYTQLQLSNDAKRSLVTTSYAVPVGRASGEYTIGSKTRLTITGTNASGTGYFYCSPKKMLINISSSGGMNVLVEYRTGSNTKSDGAWSTYGTYSLSGWSGWNEIPLVLGTLGGGSSQTGNNWQLRLTFIMTSKNTSYPTIAHVNMIRLFADNIWSSPSTMASSGHLYSYDIAQNAYFPANIYEAGTALSSKYASTSHAHDDRYLKLTGGKLTGSLEINSTGSSWSEGIRIHPSSNNWGGIVLCESSNSGATGTSAKTWSMHNNEGVFGFYQNGSNISSVTAGLSYNGSQWIMKNGNSNQILFPTSAGTIALTSQIPSVSNATITIKQTGLSDQTFTLNGSATTITLVDTNTWRPLGTGASDACAGNDSRLSDARPASDVYDWAKASTKPSYTHNEIGAGVLTIGDGANRLMFRTNASYANGIYYSTPGNEALVFATKYNVTSWIFATTDPTQQAAWTGLTPSLQIKNGRVTINKLIAGGTDAAYNLDVNGTLNATTIYENGSALAAVATSGSYNDLSNKPTIPTKSSWNYDDRYARYDAAQTLTDAQKIQARSNIGAGTSSFTGYTSSNKLSTNYIQNDAGWTSNTGTVTSVKVGNTSYSPSSGVVSLPAYPTKSSWNYDDVYIKLTENQSISGVKTFNSTIQAAGGINIGNTNSIMPIVINSSTSGNKFVRLYPTTNNSSNFDIYLPAAAGTLALVGDNNHSHTLSIASGGTASINLAANTTYTLTAGGSTLVFKTPPASSAYYANQYNQTYYLSSNSAASLWSEDIQAGMVAIGLGGGNATVIGIGWPGLASGSFKRSLLFTGNRVDLTLIDRDQNYLKGLSIDMYDDDYYTLHIRANEYSDLYGSVDTENNASVNLHAYSFEYTPSSTNSAVTNKKYVQLGVVMHNITYTYSSSVLLKMNIRGNTPVDSAITSYANLCSLLYYAGYRSAATCLTCSGRYSSYSYVVLGVFASAYNSGLTLVYCSTSNNSVSTLSIASGTVTDTISVSLVP